MHDNIVYLITAVGSTSYAVIYYLRNSSLAPAFCITGLGPIAELTVITILIRQAGDTGIEAVVAKAAGAWITSRLTVVNRITGLNAITELAIITD